VSSALQLKLLCEIKISAENEKSMHAMPGGPELGKLLTYVVPAGRGLHAQLLHSRCANLAGQV